MIAASLFARIVERTRGFEAQRTSNGGWFRA